MKTSFKPASYFNILLIALVSPVFFIACKKENVTSAPAKSIARDEISENDAVGIYTTETGNNKIVLQPGPEEGQDSWVQWYANDASYADGNFATSYQITLLAWTINGGFIKTHGLIQFPALSQIPPASHIIKAQLYLYGLDPNDPYLPEGDSYYPGSPYKKFGPNDAYVQRILSAWDESTVTWNNMPASTVKKETLISPSTSQWNYNTSFDVSNLIQPMINDPSRNHGFMFTLSNETVYHSLSFYSSDATDPQKRPKLIIVYKN